MVWPWQSPIGPALEAGMGGGGLCYKYFLEALYFCEVVIIPDVVTRIICLGLGLHI